MSVLWSLRLQGANSETDLKRKMRSVLLFI
jgi:hypothetical protein